jgi:hypothetical protein
VPHGKTVRSTASWLGVVEVAAGAAAALAQILGPDTAAAQPGIVRDGRLPCCPQAPAKARPSSSWASLSGASLDSAWGGDSWRAPDWRLCWRRVHQAGAAGSPACRGLGWVAQADSRQPVGTVAGGRRGRYGAGCGCWGIGRESGQWPILATQRPAIAHREAPWVRAESAGAAAEGAMADAAPVAAALALTWAQAWAAPLVALDLLTPRSSCQWWLSRYHQRSSLWDLSRAECQTPGVGRDCSWRRRAATARAKAANRRSRSWT